MSTKPTISSSVISTNVRFVADSHEQSLGVAKEAVMQESLNQFLRDLRTQIEIEFDLRGIDLAFSDADLLHDLQYGRDD